LREIFSQVCNCSQGEVSPRIIINQDISICILLDPDSLDNKSHVDTMSIPCSHVSDSMVTTAQN